MVRHTNPLIRAVEAANSPLPPSFDGSALAFSLSLSSLMMLSCMGLMIFVWMCRELRVCIRDGDDYPWGTLFSHQVIYMLCGLQAFIRCAPEVAAMTAYRETSLGVYGSILAVKMWANTIAGPIGFTWMSLVWVYYPSSSSDLLYVANLRQNMPPVPRKRVRRIALAIVLIVVISLLIGFGKTLRAS